MYIRQKVVVSHEGDGFLITESEWPCEICRKSVDLNFILCSVCGMWVHKSFKWIIGMLQNTVEFE